MPPIYSHPKGFLQINNENSCYGTRKQHAHTTTAESPILIAYFQWD